MKILTLAAFLAAFALGGVSSVQAASARPHAATAAHVRVVVKAVAATPVCCVGGNCCAMLGCCDAAGACCASSSRACTSACGCLTMTCCTK